MILAARARWLSLVVHGVDDTGALCGARPDVPSKSVRGGWRLVRRVPINCPRCLIRMASERYAVCETPTAHSLAPLHIRRVGVEGVQKSGNGAGALTLCALVVGWDLEELSADVLAGYRASRRDLRLCGPCLRIYSSPGLGLVREQILSAQR